MPKRKPKLPTLPDPPVVPAPDPSADLRAKLRQLDALRRQAKAALAMAPSPAPKPKPKRQRGFSGSWGCG